MAESAFCTSLGLAPEEDFPLQNRPIYPLNIAHLNSDSLKQQEVQIKIARAINNLMTLHKNHKGIIHTTSYKQLNFIKENISQTNKRRPERYWTIKLHYSSFLSYSECFEI
jgi:ATP-dependent DNA helicase DinG